MSSRAGSAAVDAGGVDQDLQPGGGGRGGVEVERGLDPVEAADERREAQMVDLPQQRDVVGVETVGAAFEAGGLDGLLMGGEQPAAGGERQQGEQGGAASRAVRPRSAAASARSCAVPGRSGAGRRRPRRRGGRAGSRSGCRTAGHRGGPACRCGPRSGAGDGARPGSGLVHQPAAGTLPRQLGRDAEIGELDVRRLAPVELQQALRRCRRG